MIIPKKNFGEICIHVDRGRERERVSERERERDRQTDRQTETERHTEICEQIGLLIIHKKELRGNLYTCRERERQTQRDREGRGDKWGY